MSAQHAVPDDFAGRPFRFGRARANGMSKWAIDQPVLERPHWGVRTTEVVATHLDLCLAFLPRMRPWHAFSDVSAATFWGLPTARPVTPDVPVSIVVPEGRHPPRGPRIRSRRIRPDLWSACDVDGVPLADPLLTWLMLARWVDLDTLVMVGDALVTRADNYPGRHPQLRVVSLEEVDTFAMRIGTATGAPRLRAAAALIRPGVESPMETVLRLRLAEAGFTGLQVNLDMYGNGVRLGRGDLVDPDAQVVVEYEGDGHRSDVSVFRGDVTRTRRLQAAGWQVVRVTADDLRAGAGELIAHVRHAYVLARARSRFR